jgi:hypothetical protein
MTPLRFVLAALLLASFWSFGRAIVIAAQGPSQEAQNVRFGLSIDDLTRRLGEAEVDLKSLKPDVAVMKSDMAEVKWIARGAAGIVVAQILMAAFGIPIKRRQPSSSDRIEV